MSTDAVLNRLPPHNRDAERALIGCMLRDNSTVEEVVGLVRESDFHVAAHGFIFHAIISLCDSGSQADLVTVAEALIEARKLDDVRVDYLADLWDCTPSAGLFRQYAASVADAAKRRDALQIAGRMIEGAYDPGTPPEDVLAVAERDICELATAGSSNEVIPVSTAMRRFWERIDERKDRGAGEPSGIEAGFVDLDGITGGLQNSELSILAARPSVGKTALALAIAMNAASQGLPVLFVSLEQEATELCERMICTSARVNGHSIRNGAIGQADLEKMFVASERLSDTRLYIDDTSSQNMLRIGANARRLKRRDGLRLMVIDYIQLIDPDDRRSPRQEQVAAISRRLKGLARELKIPVLCLAQLNRASEQGGRKPRLSDLRECVAAQTPLIDADTGRVIPICEIQPGQMVLGMDDHQEIVGGKVEDVWKTGTEPTFRLTTKTGRWLECTARHPIRTQRGYVEYKDLLPSDCIAVAFNARAGGRSDRDDACRLLGYMAGNGSAQEHRTLGLIIPDERAFADACGIIKKMFPKVEIKLRNNAYNDAWISRTFENGYGKPHGNEMINWLQEVGAHGSRDSEKSVCQFVFESGAGGAANFLAGYLATDGCVKKRKKSGWAVHFDTTSKTLAEGVAVLCARIGVLAAVGPGQWNEKSTKPIYRVSLSGESQNIRQFKDMVPAVGHRADLLALAAADVKDTRNGPFLLPVEISALASQVDSSRRFQGKRMNRELCVDVAMRSGNQTLRDWSLSDVIWDPIASMEPAGVQDVYDARVAGIHNFLAGGMIVHNSGAIEQDADMVMLMHKDQDGPCGVVQLCVAKNRNGPRGDVNLMYVPEFMRFENFAHDWRGSI